VGEGSFLVISDVPRLAGDCMYVPGAISPVVDGVEHWQSATGYLDTLAGTTGEATDPTTWLSLDYAYDAGGNIRNIDGRAHKPAIVTHRGHDPGHDLGGGVVLQLRRAEPARHRQDRRAVIGHGHDV